MCTDAQTRQGNARPGLASRGANGAPSSAQCMRHVRDQHLLHTHPCRALQGLVTVRAFRQQAAFEQRNSLLLDGSNRAWWPAQVGARKQTQLRRASAPDAPALQASVASPIPPDIECKAPPTLLAVHQPLAVHAPGAAGHQRRVWHGGAGGRGGAAVGGPGGAGADFGAQPDGPDELDGAADDRAGGKC